MQQSVITRAFFRRSGPAASAVLLLLGLGVAGAQEKPATPTAPAITPVAPTPVAVPPAPVPIERLPNGDIRLGVITLHRKERVLSFPATVNMNTNMIMEMLIATPEGRLHESLLKTEARPIHLQTMLYLLDLKNGPRVPDAKGNQGDLVDIDIEWAKADGTKVVEPAENFVWNNKAETVMKRSGWVFVGTTISNGVSQADSEGNIAISWAVGNSILDLAGPEADVDDLFNINVKHTDPPLGTPVRVIITPRKAVKP